MPRATHMLIVTLALLVVGAPARAETPPPKKKRQLIELEVIGPGGAESPVYDAADLDALLGGEMVGQLRGERFGPNAVLLVEDIDGVERLVLREAPSSGCEVLRPTPGPAPRGVVLSACDPVCPDGARFERRPGRSTAAKARYLSGPAIPAGYVATVSIGKSGDPDPVVGHVKLEASDGTRLDRDFEARRCTTRQRPRRAAPVHGLAWSERPVAADKLPGEPLSGFLVDRAVTKLSARVTSAGAGYTLAFYAGAGSCEHPAVAFMRPGAVDGVYLELTADELRSGQRVTARSHLSGARDGRVVVLAWREPALAADALQSEDHAVTVAVDAVELAAGEVRGRLYAAFGDRGHSLLVGAFTAEVCAAPER